MALNGPVYNQSNLPYHSLYILLTLGVRSFLKLPCIHVCSASYSNCYYIYFNWSLKYFYFKCIRYTKSYFHVKITINIIIVFPTSHSDIEILPNFIVFLLTICSLVGVLIFILTLLLFAVGFWKRRNKSKGIKSDYCYKL